MSCVPILLALDQSPVESTEQNDGQGQETNGQWLVVLFKTMQAITHKITQSDYKPV